MASIQENRKNGKLISFKFRACLGRDQEGKQHFKTRVWKPDKNYSESRMRKLAEKEASLWEREVNLQFQVAYISIHTDSKTPRTAKYPVFLRKTAPFPHADIPCL